MDPRLIEFMRSAPTERWDRWAAAGEADRFVWFSSLLDRVAVQEWTLEQTRAALRRGQQLTVADIESIRKNAFDPSPTKS